MAVQRIDGYGAADLMAREGAVVIDVREAEDYAAGHIEGAVHVPFDRFMDVIGSAAPEKDAPVIVYCYVGGRSAAAAQALARMGYTQVYNMGGFGSWPFEVAR